MPSTLVEALNTLPHLSLSTLWIDTTVKHISQMGKLNLSRFTSASRSHTANVEYGLELVSSQLQCSSCCMRAKKPTAVSCYFSGPASLFNTQCLLNRPHQSARLTASTVQSGTLPLNGPTSLSSGWSTALSHEPDMCTSLTLSSLTWERPTS